MVKPKIILNETDIEVLSKVQALEETLKCKVCDKTFVDPFLILKCGCTGCKRCIDDHSSMSCPICEAPLNSKETMEDTQIRDMLLHLQKLKVLLGLESEIPKKVPVEKEANVAKNAVISTPKMHKTRHSSGSSAKSSTEKPSKEIARTPVVPKKRLSNKISPGVSTPNSAAASPSGGNINKKNCKGETLLHRAVIKGDVEKVKELIKQGASVNTRDHNGWTPLHEASNHGLMDMTRLLLDNGSLVNVPSLMDNITPLHDALLNGYQMSVAILLASRGADLYAKTSFGYTALDLCNSEEDKAKLKEACSPFIDANTLIPKSSNKAPPAADLVFLSSNLSDDQKTKLQKCANMIKAQVVEDFSPQVTHIVTSCDNMGNCTRTLKILMGLLSGKWLINFQWIEVCLEYKQKVDEEVFEVQGTKNQPNTQGPKRARLNAQQKFPPLFDGLHFFLSGTFSSPTPSREDLCNLIHMGGGKLLSREPRPPPSDATPSPRPFHATDTPLEKITELILYQDKPKEVSSDVIGTTQVMWLIACIAEFKLLPFLGKKE